MGWFLSHIVVRSLSATIIAILGCVEQPTHNTSIITKLKWFGSWGNTFWLVQVLHVLRALSPKWKLFLSELNGRIIRWYVYIDNYKLLQDERTSHTQRKGGVFREAKGVRYRRHEPALYGLIKRSSYIFFSSFNLCSFLCWFSLVQHLGIIYNWLITLVV